MTIIISAGHNPQKVGACNGDFCEYPVATDWIKEIHSLIEPIYPCIIVPTGTLTSKVTFINSHPEAVVAVELHFNSNVNAEGVEALHHPRSKNGKILAEMFCDGFEKRGLFLPNRGAKIGYYQMNPDKPIDFFLRMTNPVACILEPDFISQKRRIVENKEEACYAIANILIDFVTTTLKEKI